MGRPQIIETVVKTLFLLAASCLIAFATGIDFGRVLSIVAGILLVRASFQKWGD